MKNKLKVMILHNLISPYRLPLFEELSKKYNLTVYFCRETDNERKWSTKFDGYSFKYKILPSYNLGPLVINPTLKKELKENNFDIYIISENPENAFSIIEIVHSMKRNQKIILWNERADDEIFSESKNPLKKITCCITKNVYRRYREWLYKKSNYFISFSNKATKFLISKGVVNQQIYQTNQIMPKSLLLKSIEKKNPIAVNNKNVILYLGYLNERKGVNYLIEAFNSLNRKDILLLLVGVGDMEEKLRELAENNSNIRFIGYKGEAEKSDYYSSADFFVFPTLRDCWGLVVNEAFYYGLPVISTNKAGAIELIEEGKTGFIVPDKDPNALADAMKKLLEHPKLLKKMKENVKHIPESKIVDIQTTVNTFDKVIKDSSENHETLNKTKK